MSNRKQALVLLIPGFAASEADTVCLPQQQIFVRALRKKCPDLHITILAFQYPFTFSPYTWHGAQVIPFNGKEKGGIRRLRVWWQVWSRLKQINRQYSIAGILSFWCGECGLVGSRFGRKYGLPHYCWILGQDTRPENKYVKRMDPKPAELIALSDFLQTTFYKNHHILPGQVIPPGIDTNAFPQQPLQKDIDIMGAGSLIPLKQFSILLEVVAYARNYLPQVKVVLCGKGPELIVLQGLIEQLQLKNHVELKGEIPHPQVLQLMQRSRLFLHPSSYEGFSGVCMEALFAGADVVSFHQPMTEGIPHWYIVHSVEEMKQKVLELLRVSGANHGPVLYHSIEDTVQKVLELFCV